MLRKKIDRSETVRKAVEQRKEILKDKKEERKRTQLLKEAAVSVQIEKFAGYVPKGPLVKLEGIPVVLRRPPSGFTRVKPEERKQWLQDMESILGPGFKMDSEGGTISWCEATRGPGKEWWPCDCDEDTPNVRPKRLDGDLLEWASTPIVFQTTPTLYELIDSSNLKEWSLSVEKEFGIKVGASLSSVATNSFCEEGADFAAHKCDADFS